jgi:hypothetical protein
MKDKDNIWKSDTYHISYTFTPSVPQQAKEKLNLVEAWNLAGQWIANAKEMK